MPYCTTKDITLYYEIYGKGQPLLLLSGLGGGTWSWFGQTPFFEKYYRTITFDNRGAGRSEIPPGPYHMRDFARDALSLLEHLRVEKAFILGLSMGGMIAQELALMAPQRILALFLGCTHCGGVLRVSPSPEVLKTLMNNKGLTHEQVIRKNLPLFFSREYLENHPKSIDKYIEAQLQSALQPKNAFEAQLGAIRDFDCCNRLSAVSAPTMIVTGDRDVLIPAENAHILAQRIPHAELIEIPGAAHALHVECRDKINSLAHDFFRKHSNKNGPAENL